MKHSKKDESKSKIVFKNKSTKKNKVNITKKKETVEKDAAKVIKMSTIKKKMAMSLKEMMSIIDVPETFNQRIDELLLVLSDSKISNDEIARHILQATTKFSEKYNPEWIILSYASLSKKVLEKDAEQPTFDKNTLFENLEVLIYRGCHIMLTDVFSGGNKGSVDGIVTCLYTLFKRMVTLIKKESELIRVTGVVASLLLDLILRFGCYPSEFEHEKPSLVSFVETHILGKIAGHQETAVECLLHSVALSTANNPRMHPVGARLLRETLQKCLLPGAIKTPHEYMEIICLMRQHYDLCPEAERENRTKDLLLRLSDVPEGLDHWKVMNVFTCRELSLGEGHWETMLSVEVSRIKPVVIKRSHQESLTKALRNAQMTPSEDKKTMKVALLDPMLLLRKHLSRERAAQAVNGTNNTKSTKTANEKLKSTRNEDSKESSRQKADDLFDHAIKSKNSSQSRNKKKKKSK